MQWRYREKQNDQEHREKVSFFHLAKFWMAFFCFWENVLLNSHVPCYVTCSCRKTFKSRLQTFSKTGVLKNFAILSQEKTCVEASLRLSFRTEGLHFYLKKIQRRCFPVNIARFLWTAFFIEDLLNIPFRNFYLMIDNWYFIELHFTIVKLGHLTERTLQ